MKSDEQLLHISGKCGLVPLPAATPQMLRNPWRIHHSPSNSVNRNANHAECVQHEVMSRLRATSTLIR
jgi:hypothetical protein